MKKIDDYRWEIPREGNMRVSGILYSDEKMMELIRADQSAKQVANVAHLPGIIKHSMAMPDVHYGYGFPIGGVAAFDLNNGVISPGGVGYDINCGVRVLRTGLTKDRVIPHMKQLVNALFHNIPSGVGSHRRDLTLSVKEEQQVLRNGAQWAVDRGYGSWDDLNYIEENGCISGADPENVSDKALERGRKQLGTLGSGNHFVEIGYVEEVLAPEEAETLGLYENQVTVFIHTGSRGLGYQICDDYIRVMVQAAQKYNIHLPDRQLCCAPVTSKEGQRYLSAMACAANYAFTNRQMITHWSRESFEQILGIPQKNLKMSLVYDVCHNIAKIETHTVDGVKMKLCVHRKGATRAFGPGHPHLPDNYRTIGQPVLIPGDMGTESYILTGTQKAMEETFGSTCHGAGRKMSRAEAKRVSRGRPLARELQDRGVYVQSAGKHTLAEEMPEAYKNVSDVVNVVHQAGISKLVARLKPLGVIKG